MISVWINFYGTIHSRNNLPWQMNNGNFWKKNKIFFAKTRLVCEWNVPWNYMKWQTNSSWCHTPWCCVQRKTYNFKNKISSTRVSSIKWRWNCMLFFYRSRFLGKWIIEKCERKIKYFFTEKRYVCEWIDESLTNQNKNFDHVIFHVGVQILLVQDLDWDHICSLLHRS